MKKVAEEVPTGELMQAVVRPLPAHIAALATVFGLGAGLSTSPPTPTPIPRVRIRPERRIKVQNEFGFIVDLEELVDDKPPWFWPRRRRAQG